jgi:hypothetical protein
MSPAGVVVLDEAGIVDTRRLARLFTHAARSGSALVLVGDPRQLPEIEAGGLFTRLAQSPRTLRLSDNKRQQNDWERDALSQLRAGNIDDALGAYTVHGRIHDGTDPEELRAELVTDYLHTRANAEKPYDVAILAVTRADVAQLNALVRAALNAQGKLGLTPLHLRADDTADLVAGDDSVQMRTGDLVIIGRNDNRLGLYNGTRGTVTAVDVAADSLTLRTDDDRDVTVTATWAAHHDLRHAYAMTLHKAQGLTVDHALLYGSEALTREAGYVGLSRGRRENHIYATTREISARNGECDFAKRDPLADEQQPVTDLPDGCTTAGRTDLLASTNPSPGEARAPTTNTPAPDRKGCADDHVRVPRAASPGEGEQSERRGRDGRGPRLRLRRGGSGARGQHQLPAQAGHGRAHHAQQARSQRALHQGTPRRIPGGHRATNGCPAPGPSPVGATVLRAPLRDGHRQRVVGVSSWWSGLPPPRPARPTRDLRASRARGPRLRHRDCTVCCLSRENYLPSIGFNT